MHNDLSIKARGIVTKRKKNINSVKRKLHYNFMFYDDIMKGEKGPKAFTKE